ncbi:beta-mannosidase isoform X1 [Patella vulgata]|uniref:beta-mannosidase isoform X1 n=2 Tax=Patella vulgata TaxID=6465 RepID=UPI0024A8B3D8|nr:beta-mannosidase isoform X1 [Patella vulgata]
MYVRYTYDIKNVVKPGNNTITVAFRSAVKEAERLANESPYFIPPNCTVPAQHGECHVQFIRKAQCSFSWNWGPSFPVQGIWHDIYIQSFDTTVIREYSALTKKAGDNTWSVDVEVHFDVRTGSTTGELETQLVGTPVSLRQVITLNSANSSVRYTLNIPKEMNIAMWWPNGYGNQSLYELTVKFTSDKSQESTAKTIKIGFRTVEIVQVPVSNNPKHGLTFFYKINDVPVFFKGTNWIPADSFLERVTYDKIRILLTSAAEVHINSMRVWGGGIYESDSFYELADELGIMIWSDFMFSVALYPTTKSFLDTVTIETRQQVRRIKHHPCIAVWAGNNENEAGITQGWFGVKDVDPYKADYIKLYINTIGSIVQQEDTTREYLSSSPSDGKLTKQSGGIAPNPTLEYFGDVHFYSNYVDLWDWRNVPIPRFASEYGSESWCNYETLQPVFAEEDLDYWSYIANWRNRDTAGNFVMMTEAMTHIQLPNSPYVKERFQDLIYVTQIHQAMTMRVETEHYRRHTNWLGADGRGLTMGAMFWQINDIWQAPTWASIDYDLKWKMIHYYARHFFDPNLISPYINGTNLNIYMVIDEIPNHLDRHPDTHTLEFRPLQEHRELKEIYPNVDSEKVMAMDNTVIMEMYTWNNLIPLKTWTIPYHLNKTSGLIFQENLDDLLSEAGCFDQKNCLFYFYLNSKSNPTSTSWLPLTYFTDIQDVINEAQITINQVTSQSATEFSLVLSTNNIAPFVWINAYNISGRFSDNGFLMKDPLLQLTFTSWQPVDLDTFKKSLTVKSLMNMYY